MPLVTMIAGPNGSGKSTLTNRLVSAGITLGDYFNADDIAAGMDGDPTEVAQLAQQIVRDKRSAALTRRRNHAFETVMSHPSHIEHFRQAKTQGFATRLIFVCTDGPSFNVGRVANRVQHGGHPVPNDRIVARYYRSLANLPAAVETSDTVMIFDNSYIDRPFKLLAIIKNAILTHGEVPKTRTGVAINLPTWWREIVQIIKPIDPFRDGPLHP